MDESARFSFANSAALNTIAQGRADDAPELRGDVVQGDVARTIQRLARLAAAERLRILIVLPDLGQNQRGQFWRRRIIHPGIAQPVTSDQRRTTSTDPSDLVARDSSLITFPRSGGHP